MANFAIIIFLCSCNGSATSTKEELLSTQEDFCNLINIKNVPEKEDSYGRFVFADLGSWSAYALPENESGRYAGAFIGPMIMTGQGWISATLAQPIITVNGAEYDLVRNVQTTKYLPGRLVQEFGDEKLHFKTELCFATNRSAVVRSAIRNVGDKQVEVSLHWRGTPFDPDCLMTADGTTVKLLRRSDSAYIETRFITAQKASVANGAVESDEKAITLQPGEEYKSAYSQSLLLPGDDVSSEADKMASLDIDDCFDENQRRWNSNIATLLSRAEDKYRLDNKYRRVLVKSMLTLNTNWRSPAGDILHAGSNPSYVGFSDGIWSWDSWKIASGNVFYNPELAKDEMRTLFDYQARNGMVPDFIGYDKTYNNWRDSKPPIAAWAAMNVYAETKDRNFIEEMFDKLLLFHNWWYAERDHDHNGICEYGSTDGSLIAACWESGMDNGVRFDDSEMLQNGENAWSMNQENICLNSFLYQEKMALSKMAEILGRDSLAENLASEAEGIKKFIQTKMFDEETGFFYDRKLGSGELVKVMGCEGWLPLWAGIATQHQAELVARNMMDESKFNSFLPLGTLEISDPRLRPIRGYWRGTVWVDQVYFGVTGLRNYGFDKEADYLMEKFISNAQGLVTDGPIHENYNPLTGEALNSPNFGWSSALIIKMLLNN